MKFFFHEASIFFKKLYFYDIKSLKFITRLYSKTFADLMTIHCRRHPHALPRAVL